jgi:hypothetical protein
MLGVSRHVITYHTTNKDIFRGLPLGMLRARLEWLWEHENGTGEESRLDFRAVFAGALATYIPAHALPDVLNKLRSL